MVGSWRRFSRPMTALHLAPHSVRTAIHWGLLAPTHGPSRVIAEPLGGGRLLIFEIPTTTLKPNALRFLRLRASPSSTCRRLKAVIQPLVKVPCRVLQRICGVSIFGELPVVTISPDQGS